MQAVITTRHNKAEYLSSVLKKAGLTLQAYEGFDTDTLGSFCKTVERRDSPEACALIKAKIACEATGSAFGIGSEGSFGGGPYSSFFNWNQEVLCFYDTQTEQAIYAYAEGPVGLESIPFTNRKVLTEWVNRFPGQRWMLLKQENVTKGLTHNSLLKMAKSSIIKEGDMISPDLRAMYSPTRQILLAEVAKDLQYRLQSHCPECHARDFVVKKHESGLPCGLCRTATSKVRAHISHCTMCGYQQAERLDDVADPYYCSVCNP
ncbi:DUF6671 family protein [Alteromonas antoniana]|uniref:DUF6671 family protein n=1 Tax=Alteromonas antoniana TaxID=2803813 RepID=UPI001C464CC1|nr:DUF6671 family protein [Alteromonas antoniana]